MKIKKLSWLGALVAFAAVVGAVGYAPTTTQAAAAPATKTCVQGAGLNSATCSLTFTETIVAPFAVIGTTVENITLTSGNATFTGAVPTVTSTAGCTPVVLAPPILGGNVFTVQVNTTAVGALFPVPVVCTITVSGEGITLTGAATAGISQNVTTAATNTLAGGTPVGATVAATSGALAFTPAAPTALTKVCTTAATAPAQATTVVVGQVITCTVAITPGTGIQGGQTATITLQNGTFTTTGLTTATVVVGTAGTAVTTFTEPTFSATTSNTVPTQTIALGGVTLAASTNITSVTPNAGATTLITFVGCQGATGFIAGGAAITAVTPGQAVTCRFALTDADAQPNAVASGIVAVTQSGNVINSTLGTVSSPGGGTISQVGATTTIRCGALPSGPAAPETCQFVDVSFTGTQTSLFTNLPQIVGVNISYTSDLPAVNTSAQQNFGNVFTVALGTSALVQPVLQLQCTSTNTTAISGSVGTIINNGGVQGVVVPGQIGGSGALLATGILPTSVPCSVIGAGTFTTPLPVAPGTFEISSVNGIIIDANGRLTTNLRIACGDNAAFVGQSTINLNTCTGVQFSVLGQNVGNAEVRVRYEPSSFSAASGILEREIAGTVSFIAPTVTVALTLTPNPIVVAVNPNNPVANTTNTALSEIGTATATFNRSFNCGGVFGIASAFACINPATGLPITLDFGSVLNGTVVFQIDNTAIARFVTTTNSATSPGVTGVSVASTAGQVAVRCGSFSSLAQANGGFGTGNFASFFGGCDTASVNYVGVNPGDAQIAAVFIPDLPGAVTGVFASGLSSLAGVNFFANGSGFNGLNSFSQRTIQVVGAAPATTQTLQLARGCNNITPTVTESVTAYIARVSPASAVNSVFQFNTASNTFAGAPGPGAPAGAAAVADLAGVTRLTPVFVCVSQAATLTQPAV